MTIKDYLKTSGDEIQKAITTFLKKENHIDQKNPLLKKLFKTFSESTNGGKHIRGALVRIGYLLMNDTEDVELLSIAAAYEMLHTALLIHDDIIDNSDIRRGEESLWQKVGTKQALCLGDLGFFICYKIISESNFSGEKKAQATALLSEIVMQTIAGEMLDVALSENPSIPQENLLQGSGAGLGRKEEDVLLIHSLKTAQYTISGPLMLGAILGGADGKLLKQLKIFGESLGIAFQIQDDILGVFGNEKEIGKSVTSDIEENKNTLLITYVLENGTADQKKFLKDHYGKGTMTPEVFEKIKNIFIELGSLTYSQQKAEEYIEKAKRLIPRITTDKQIQNLLTQLTDFIIQRNK